MTWSPQRRATLRWLARYEFPPSARCLDVGSANHRGPNLAGDWTRIDVVPAPGIAVMDVCQMTFADEFFDVVRLVNVLHYLDAPNAALSECRRVLKPGGELLCTDLLCYEDIGWQRRTREGWRGLVKDLGFSEFTVEPLDGPLTVAAQILYSTGYRSRIVRGVAHALARLDRSAHPTWSTTMGIWARR